MTYHLSNPNPVTFPQYQKPHQALHNAIGQTRTTALLHVPAYTSMLLVETYLCDLNAWSATRRIPPSTTTAYVRDLVSTRGYTRYTAAMWQTTAAPLFTRYRPITAICLPTLQLVDCREHAYFDPIIRVIENDSDLDQLVCTSK